MGRDLKREYEAMLDQEIPDLWSRIEPQLADKKAAQAAPMRSDGSGSRASVRKKQRISRRTIAVWGSFAAACVCLAIAIPIWIRSGKGTGEKYGDRSFTANELQSSQDVYDGAVFDGAGPQESMEADSISMMEPQQEPAAAYENSAGSNAAMNNGIMQENDVDFSGFSDDEPKGTFPEDTESEPEAELNAEAEQGAAETPNEEQTPNEEAAPDAETEREKEKTVQFRGEVVEAWRAQEGYIYRIALTGDGDSHLAGGTEILVLREEEYFAADAEELQEGMTYTFGVETRIVSGEITYLLIWYR